MSVLVELKARFRAAISKGLQLEIDPQVTAAKEPKFGDYQCNDAMPLAKQLGAKPRDIAQTIVDNLDIADIAETPTIEGPGFINLRLQVDYINRKLFAAWQDDRLGVPLAEPPQRVVVDFSSPNIAKEMHVGHLRSTIIGDCIARILEFLGHQVLRLNHVGDWGTQFGMLITHLKEAFPQALVESDVLALGDLVNFYREAKKRFDEDEDFRERARLAVVDLQSGEPTARKAWQLLCEQSRREFQKIYEILDIKLEERGESFYNPFLPEVIKDLADKGLLQEDEGAKCVFLEGFQNKEGKPLPLIVQKSDGGYNYATTDLAALRYRVNVDKADRIIYVTDSGQADHFAQVFQVAKRAGWLPAHVKVEHVPFGLVLGEDGKKFKTRSGDTVALKELLSEAVERAFADINSRNPDAPLEFKQAVAQVIGIAAVKYADLCQNRNSNYVFSFDKMLSLQGNTAPYLLYAYVRIQGIGRKATKPIDRSLPIHIRHGSEIVLAKHLLQFAEVIDAVAIDLMPNRLCQYLFELSQKFNQFYDQCPILQAEDLERNSRLALCDITARTLQLGLSLLGIPVLERM
ncbi:MAG: arginine--tRNA ligase [Pseudanabaenaceae cyanobacterium SKYGB_i_bin29]|nr:arginine--tRNA ligase [Pseudanabaenaceae cyanobacterium SKYG29]MDW8421291.1 arginine--tRNA ligase [Pseudanabaenaceae cyanobacterium SKYGB_i_bin29]